jgi:uncharacterized membrane protein YdbT with pleckstrin-like domain
MTHLFEIFKESSNTFEGQEPGEEVVMLVRRHPFYIAMKFVITFIVAMIPAFVASSYAPLLIENNLGALTMFIITLWFLILWVVFFYHFTMYTLDVWIVTNKRIIDSTQHGFFNRTISELHANRIQDVSVKIDGLIQTLFRFGDIQVQTAGTEEKFKFVQVPQPERIKNEIMKVASSKSAGGHV